MLERVFNCAKEFDIIHFHIVAGGAVRFLP
jgi:hypothetical protein